jgi:anti-sigma factor RsiW
MVGNTRWTSYNDVNEHPEDSILLAYLRKQQMQDRLSVSQHIDVEKCPRCLHKLNELEQVSATLDVLGEIRCYQHYQELSVADTYARMQKAVSHRSPTNASLNGVSQRRRPRKSVVRLISLPAAFGLAVLFTVTMLVFANLSGTSRNLASPKDGLSHSQNNSTVVVAPHSTPTSYPNLTATTGITQAVTPTGASITICSTAANIVQGRLVICGYNFEAGHKVLVSVFVPGKQFIQRFTLPVDRQGDFQTGWNIVNCGNLPNIIVANEVVNAKLISARLQNISFGSCSVRTPNSRTN